MDERLGRDVAVKTVEVDETDPTAAERFRREALTTAALTHPNIVTVFDSGVDGSTAFLVMELLGGPTLQHRISAEGALPVPDVVSVGRQVAAALAAAHEAGVVHRDVKPSNVASSEDGTVKVLDFGVARLIETTAGGARLTQSSMVIGTAAYLSPEQASGKAVDARSDLYSLGCVLFTLLAGRPPFVADNEVAVCVQQVRAAPPDVRKTRPDTPAWLAHLIRRLLAKDPSRRPRDAATVLAVLERGASSLAADLPSATHALPATDLALVRNTRAQLAAERRRRRHLGIAAGIAFAAALVGVMVAALAGVTPSAQASQRAGQTTPANAAEANAAETTTTTSRAPAQPGPAQPLTPLQATANLATAVLNGEQSGALTAPAAQDLLNQLQGLMTSLSAGNSKPNDAQRKLSDLLHQLTDMTQGGQLTSAGTALLAAPLAALQQAIPASPAPPPGPAEDS